MNILPSISLIAEINDSKTLLYFLDNCIDNKTVKSEWLVYARDHNIIRRKELPVPCHSVIDHYRVLSDSKSYDERRLHVTPKATVPVIIGFLISGTEGEMARTSQNEVLITLQ